VHSFYGVMKPRENKCVIVSTRLNATQFRALLHIADTECPRATVSSALRKLVREGILRRALAPKGTQK